MKIYLAAPYTHKDRRVVKERVNKINTVASLLMNRGHIVFSPISHSHYIAVDNNLPTDFKFWQAMNHSFIDWSDAMGVLMLDGYNYSDGIEDEKKFCCLTNKHIFYIELATEGSLLFWAVPNLVAQTIL